MVLHSLKVINFCLFMVPILLLVYVDYIILVNPDSFCVDKVQLTLIFCSN